MPNDGLEVPIGVTLQRQLAAAEARMVRTAAVIQSRFQQATDQVVQGFEARESRDMGF